jgi:hypothetical protein
MSTLKTVFNKLTKEDKVELKSEKIELSLVSDFISEYNQAIKKTNELVNDWDKVQKLKSAFKKDAEKNKNQLKSLVKPLEKIKQQAKELGLDEKEINNKIGRPDLKKDIDSVDFFLKEL